MSMRALFLLMIAAGCTSNTGIPSDSEWQPFTGFEIQTHDQGPALWADALAACESMPMAHLTHQTEWQMVVDAGFADIDVPTQPEWSYWNDDHDASYFDPDAVPDHRYVEDAPLPSTHERPYRCTRPHQ